MGRIVDTDMVISDWSRSPRSGLFGFSTEITLHFMRGGAHWFIVKMQRVHHDVAHFDIATEHH